jgi:hypothetical protein
MFLLMLTTTEVAAHKSENVAESTFDDTGERWCTCDADYVCSGDVALLGQLVRILAEASSLFPAAPDSVPILDELDEALRHAGWAAREAYTVASLLNQEAALAESWAAGPSRPRGIQARHEEAIRKGHPCVEQALVPQTIERPAGGFDLSILPGERTHCAGRTRAGDRCKSPVMYIGSKDAKHCFQHATVAEHTDRRAAEAAAERER